VLPTSAPPAARLPRPRDRRRPCGSEPMGLIPPRGGQCPQSSIRYHKFCGPQRKSHLPKAALKATAVTVPPSQGAAGSPDRRRGLMSDGKSPDSAPTTLNRIQRLRLLADGKMAE